MNESIRKKIVFIALFLAIAWGFYNFLPNKNTKPQPQVTSPSTLGLHPVAQISAVEKTIKVAEMKNKSWGDDPFRAIGKKTSYGPKSEEPRWKLTGIVYNSVKPLAIVNGKSVTVGESLGTAKVIEIRHKSVILEQSGERVTLTVFKG